MTDNNADQLREIEQGVAVALQLSYVRLKRLGYSPRLAQGTLLRIARQAIARLDD